jgi:hypothetical protein
MKMFFQELLIGIIFRLLGNTMEPVKTGNLQYLFALSKKGHEGRKKRWERALAKLYKDKDMLDFLFYQAEVDKENAWAGRISREAAQGARIRTLFIVKQAHMAYIRSLGSEKTRDAGNRMLERERDLGDAYKKTVDTKPR